MKTEEQPLKEVNNVTIPSTIFRDRTLKVLEALVEYLKEQQGMNYHDIGELLNRDERTIWTVYNRAQKKRAKAKDEQVLNPNP